MHHVSRVAIGAALASGLLLLGGCGDSTDGEAASDGGSTVADSTAPETSSPSAPPTTDSSEPDPSEAPTDGGSASGLAACADVWSEGVTLPRSYRGCDEGGTTVKADKHTCSFGGALVEYDGRYYAQLGSTINDEGDLATSDAYRQALAACQA